MENSSSSALAESQLSCSTTRTTQTTAFTTRTPNQNVYSSETPTSPTAPPQIKALSSTSHTSTKLSSFSKTSFSFTSSPTPYSNIIASTYITTTSSASSPSGQVHGDSSVNTTSRKIIGPIVGAIGGVLILVFFGLGILVYRRRNRSQRQLHADKEDVTQSYDNLIRALSLPRQNSARSWRERDFDPQLSSPGQVVCLDKSSDLYKKYNIGVIGEGSRHKTVVHPDDVLDTESAPSIYSTDSNFQYQRTMASSERGIAQ